MEGKTWEVSGKNPAIAVGPMGSDVTLHSHSEHLDCCVCMDPKVVSGKESKCGHAICMECITKLQKPECPLCRGNLSGCYYTAETEKTIARTVRLNKRVGELENLVYSLYVNRYVGRDGNIIRMRARDYSEAFKSFIELNPEMTDAVCTNIFYGFISFMQLEQLTNPSDAMQQFRVIGFLMLTEPSTLFDDLYVRYITRTHEQTL